MTGWYLQRILFPVGKWAETVVTNYTFADDTTFYISSLCQVTSDLTRLMGIRSPTGFAGSTWVRFKRFKKHFGGGMMMMIMINIMATSSMIMRSFNYIYHVQYNNSDNDENMILILTTTEACIIISTTITSVMVNMTAEFIPVIN